MTDTNLLDLPKGSVIRPKGVIDEHYTTSGAIFTGYEGRKGLRIENGGWLYPEEIAEVVSVPEPKLIDKYPAGTKIAIGFGGGGTYVVAGDGGVTSDGEQYLKLANGGIVRAGAFDRGSASVIAEAPKPDTSALYSAYNIAAAELAIATDNQLDFEYVDANGEESDRYIDPTEVTTTFDGHKLIIGYDEDDDRAMKSFRVDRIAGQVALV